MCKILHIFFVVFLANFLIDLLLLFQFNKDMKQKMSMRSSSDENSDLLQKKKNMNRMVLIRSIVFILSHASQFFVAVIAILKKKSLGLLCFYGFTWFVCNLINELAHFFGILTMMLQFYIFLFFNRNFRENFDDRWKFLKYRPRIMRSLKNLHSFSVRVLILHETESTVIFLERTRLLGQYKKD